MKGTSAMFQKLVAGIKRDQLRSLSCGAPADT
jgi:hypothetical protein